MEFNNIFYEEKRKFIFMVNRKRGLYNNVHFSVYIELDFRKFDNSI